MSDKTEAKKPEKPTENKKSNQKDTAGEKVKGRVVQEVVKKVPWTLARCSKYARRFTNEAQWASASPSSYKAAVAHGWISQCLAEQSKVASNKGKVIPAQFNRPKTDSSQPQKKAA